MRGHVYRALASRTLATHDECVRLRQQQDEQREQEQLRLQEQVEAHSRELQAALAEMGDAMHAKSDFLARVSHDLRSPLTSILGYAQLISEQESPSAARKADIINKSARRLLDLVNDLVDYAVGMRESHTLQLRPAYVRSFFNSIADEARQLAQAGNNSFGYLIAPELPPLLRIDSRRLHQVLHNLLGNACKFTRNGEVRLEVGYRPLGGNDGLLLLAVTDTGCGMEPAMLERVFEPFRQLGRHSQGIGLGLAIVKQWLDQMQGRINIRTAPGKGTRVGLEIPVTSVPEQLLVPEELGFVPARHAGSLGQGRSIWLVEDSAPIRELLELELENNGFTVHAFACGNEAMLALRDVTSAAPDLVVTDFYLPGHNGLQLAAVLRQRWSQVPVILLSAGMSDGVQEGDGLFDAVLLKSLEWNELGEALETVIRRLLSPAGQDGDGLAAASSDDTQHVLHPAEHRALAGMMQVNAVSDIMRWADVMLREQPHRSALYLHVRKCAREADLAALRALL